MKYTHIPLVKSLAVLPDAAKFPPYEEYFSFDDYSFKHLKLRTLRYLLLYCDV